jgi:hypothetical protein
MIWFFLSSYALIIRFFTNLMSSMFIMSQILCAIDWSTKTYSVISIFIIVIDENFLIKQSINTEFSSNKSFFIRKDNIVNSFVFVAFSTKINLFSNFLSSSYLSQRFLIFWVLSNLCWSDLIRHNWNIYYFSWAVLWSNQNWEFWSSLKIEKSKYEIDLNFK